MPIYGLPQMPPRRYNDKRKAYETAAEQFKKQHNDVDMKTAPPELKSELANLNHAQKTYQAQQLLFESENGLLAFRDAVPSRIVVGLQPGPAFAKSG